MSDALRALAGHVRRGDDGDHARVRLGLGRVDPKDTRPRVVREAKRAVQHPRGGHVAHERLVAERELVRPS